MSHLNDLIERKREIENEHEGYNMYSHEKLKSFSDQQMCELASSERTAKGLLRSNMYVQVCLLIKREEATDSVLKERFDRESKERQAVFSKIKQYISDAQSSGLW